MLSSALFLPSATWFSWSFALGTLHPAGAEDQVIRNALFNDLVTLEPPPLAGELATALSLFKSSASLSRALIAPKGTFPDTYFPNTYVRYQTINNRIMRGTHLAPI